MGSTGSRCLGLKQLDLMVSTMVNRTRIAPYTSDDGPSP